MTSARKQADTQRIAGWVGRTEAASYVRLAERFAALAKKRKQRFVGGIELLDPADVAELSGAHRPGLIQLAREGAGDCLAWDLRRGRSDSEVPTVLYCDHEIGTAVPFARDAACALHHAFLRELIGTRGRDALGLVAAWLSDYADFVDRRARSVFDRVVRRSRSRPDAPVLRNEAEARRAAGDLIPKQARAGLAIAPPTWFPLLSPESPECLDEAARRYDEAIATYRELVEEERRPAFAWHLAAALRGLADVRLRRGRLAKAAEAAAEAVALYEPIHESGDPRVVTGLAFVHRVLAVTERRAKRLASALEHAERALTLNESALHDACVVLDALDKVASAWEAERAGRDASDVAAPLRAALTSTTAFRQAQPPHPYQPQAQRIERLAARRRRR